MLSNEVMLVRDSMTRHLLTVSPEDRASKARVLMRQSNLHALPVVSGRRLVGLVTEEDIWRRMAEAGFGGDERAEELLDQVSIGGLMNLRPCSVSPTTALVEAARLMRATATQLLPVVDNDELVGLLDEGSAIDGLLAVIDRLPPDKGKVAQRRRGSRAPARAADGTEEASVTE